MTIPVYPSKPVPGDRVAIVSPSSGLPEILPLPFELGLRRLIDDFGLIPVEYPTTRKMGSSAAARAADLHAAFADPEIKAVISSIGGDDQITVLPHLDAALLRANPKPFFGFSDCTVLLAYLASLGIVGYYGGAVMTALGRPVAMHPRTEESLRAALFSRGAFELRPSPDFTDVDRDWADPATFATPPTMRPAPKWPWHQANRIVEGPTWGGCLEIVAWLLMADRAVPAPGSLDGAVLFFETSEELPRAEEIYRILRNIGERGILGRCGAVLMGRPKAWNFEHPNTPAESDAFVAEQHEAVLRAMAAYAPDTMLVLDVDFGHTDPQFVIPYGGTVRLDGIAETIHVEY